MLLIFALVTLAPGIAVSQELILPAAGRLVSLSVPKNQPRLRGIKVHPNRPLVFDFIVDREQSSSSILAAESRQLLKYFLAGLTIPEQDLWVNLSPYENDRIVPERFGQTEMGRNLLAQDYLLKQITASLIDPKGDLGKQFWRGLYSAAGSKHPTIAVPVNIVHKVWIMPDQAVIFEQAASQSAYVVKSTLKVLLEEDYLAATRMTGTSGRSAMVRPETGMLRQLVIPALTQEVNEGHNFAPLRQIYNSLILAQWYKNKIKNSVLQQAYIDRKKVDGIRIKNPLGPETIYQQYLVSLKKGVVNWIQSEQIPGTTNSVPRKYFSGGAAFTQLNAAMTSSPSRPRVASDQDQVMLRAQLGVWPAGNAAMVPMDSGHNAQSQKEVVELIRSVSNALFGMRGFIPYTGTMTLIKELLKKPIPLIIASASTRTRIKLESYRLNGKTLLDVMDYVMDGHMIAAQKVPERPSKEFYLTVLRNYNREHGKNLEPQDVAVIDDAQEGVLSAANAGFGLIVAPARRKNSEQLSKAGAHVALEDLAYLTPQQKQNLMAQKAIIFDVDGVIFNTERIYYDSNRIVINNFLKAYGQKTGQRYRPYNWNEHKQHFIGVTLEEALARFLKERGIDLPRLPHQLASNRYSQGHSIGFAGTEDIDRFLASLPLAEGHVHFGSSVPQEVLWQLALDRRDLDWTEVNTYLQENYNKFIDMGALLDKARDPQTRPEELVALKEEFFSYCIFNPQQNVELKRFNVGYKIIALLTRGDESSYESFAKAIGLNNYQNGVKVLVQRTALPAADTVAELERLIQQKINAMRRGFEAASQELQPKKKGGIGFQAKLVLSVERFHTLPMIERQVTALLQVLENHKELRDFVVAIDVADDEQLKSPIDFGGMFERIQDYNRRRQSRGEPSLATTYHVGEDYRHVTLESALRHVDQVLDFGVSGIGHGLSLAIDPFRFLNRTRQETIRERVAQIYYDLKLAAYHSQELEALDITITPKDLWSELQSLGENQEQIRTSIIPEIQRLLKLGRIRLSAEQKLLASISALPIPGAIHTVVYDERKLKDITKRQQLVLNHLIEKGVVIESNPTTNYLIGPIKSYAEHPLPRILGYVYSGLQPQWQGQRPRVTLNTDNPTIMGINIRNEYRQMILTHGLTQQDVLAIARNGIDYRLGKFPLSYGAQIEEALARLPFASSAMRAQDKRERASVGRREGGINLQARHMNLRSSDSGDKLSIAIDSAMLKQIQEATGLEFKILRVRPLKDLPSFLQSAEPVVL